MKRLVATILLMAMCASSAFALDGRSSGGGSIATSGTGNPTLTGNATLDGFTYLKNTTNRASNNLTAEIGVTANQSVVAWDIFSTSTPNLDGVWETLSAPLNSADPTAGSRFSIYPSTGTGGINLYSANVNLNADGQAVTEIAGDASVGATLFVAGNIQNRGSSVQINAPSLKLCNAAGANCVTYLYNKFQQTDTNVFPVPFATGLIAALPATTSLYGITQISSQVVQSNLFVDTGVVIFAGTTLTCTVQPTVKLQDCGASLPTTCGSPTTLAHATISAANTAIAMTLDGPAGNVGDYIAFEISAGTCTVVAGNFNGTVNFGY